MKIFPGKSYSTFLIREFLKVFLVCVIFIMGLSFIVRTLQRVDSLKTYTLFQVIIMRILEAPEIISRETLLASCMFASVYIMSNLSNNREILALRTCGVSIYRIISPLIFLGFLIGISSLVFEDFVVIKSFSVKDRYLAMIRGEKPKEKSRDRNNIIVFGEGNIIYKIDRFVSRTDEMLGIMVIKKREDGGISLRIDAQKGTWDGKNWIFYNGVKRTFSNDGGVEVQKEFSQLESGFTDNPRYFGRETKDIQDITLKEGYEYITMMKKMGLNYLAPLTKFHRKLAQGVTLFLVVIIGLALGSMAFKNALVISFSLTLGVVLVFFFLIEIGYTFGSSGIIHPVLGGWLGNIVFFIVCVYLLRKLRV